MNGFSLDQKDAVNKAGFGSLLRLKELEWRVIECINKRMQVDR